MTSVPSALVTREREKKKKERVSEEVGCCMQFANHMAAGASCVKVHVPHSHVGVNTKLVYILYRTNASIDHLIDIRTEKLEVFLIFFSVKI